jgi:transposase InsO family protein
VNHKLLKKLLRHWKLALPRRIKKKRQSSIARTLSALGASVNLVKQIPSEERKPLMILYTDFTEIQYVGGKAYLAAYVDDISKRAPGYAFGASPDAPLALEAYRKTRRFMKRYGVDLSTVYMHQDQGSVFTGYEYVAALVSDGITPSYSRKATPGDNPAMESFFGRLKDEWGQQFRDADTYEELRRIVSKALRYYNHRRIHSELDGKSPDEFLNNHPSLS